MGATSCPALKAIVPQLVPGDLVQEANGGLATSGNAARIRGRALAGLLVAVGCGGWVHAERTTSVVVAAICYLRISKAGTVTMKAGMLRDLLQGWRVFSGLRWVAIMCISFALISALFVGSWQVLGPSIISNEGEALGRSALAPIQAIGLLVRSLVLIRVH